MTNLIHKAGGVYGDLVIEPLGGMKYLWKNGDGRGVAMAQYENENKFWTLEIAGETYFFIDDRALDKVVFRTPPMEKINAWIEGTLIPKTSKDIVFMTKQGMKTFLDLPQEFYYDMATLVVLESWAIERLNTVFYVAIVGGFGGGKTVSLEVLKSLCRHGVLSGSITAAGSSRIIEEQKLSVFYDEIDVKDNMDDNQLYMSIRQGYRRGNRYIRLKAKTFEPEFFESFGVKGFSLHSDIERATKTRAFTINIGETNDSRLPVLNMKKDSLLNEIHDELFFWYMENITNAYLDLDVAPKIDLSAGIEAIRKSLYQNAVSNMSAKELEFLDRFRGRNTELGYIALQISAIFGVDFLDSLTESFKEKEEMENDFDENSIFSMLKDILVVYINQECVEQQIVYNSLNIQMEQLKLKNLSPHKFKSMLREFGFVDGVNRKKKKTTGVLGDKSVYHLFFDGRVKPKLVSHISQVSQNSGFQNDEKETLLPYIRNHETEESQETTKTKITKEVD